MPPRTEGYVMICLPNKSRHLAKNSAVDQLLCAVHCSQTNYTFVVAAIFVKVWKRKIDMQFHVTPCVDRCALLLWFLMCFAVYTTKLYTQFYLFYQCRSSNTYFNAEY